MLNFVDVNYAYYVTECSLDEFVCDNGDCVPLNAICNDRNDCADFSDERNCGRHNIHVDR